MPAAIQFSHVHIYADNVRPLAEYKAMEERSNRFAELLLQSGCVTDDGTDIEKGRQLWSSLGSEPAEFKSQDQDVVAQLITGAGFRITSSYECAETRTVCLSTSAREGVNVVVTSPVHELATPPNGGPYPISSTPGGTCGEAPAYLHFGSGQVKRFYDAHCGRQGIGVLCFDVGAGDADLIVARYAKRHPKLQPVMKEYDGVKVVELLAYYKGKILTSEPDEGTVLRFIERPHERLATAEAVLPGLVPCGAAWRKAPFDFHAFCDHWVSNVVSREGFLQTLEDGLGFVPQVEFNAGVVAAGEARIESTVTGNKSTFRSNDRGEAFRNQSQVYLPINNALSDKGHVHWFLEEVGQGVQHVASRVSDLIKFIQSVNDMREMTGAGFSFLNIPRSYYGSLTAAALVKDAGVSASEAAAIIEALQMAGVADNAGVVRLDVTVDAVSAACVGTPSFVSIGRDDQVARARLEAKVGAVVLRSRYSNLHALLRDHVSEGTYLGIVRNKILVDVQGDDLLYQIFTSNILQRKVGEQSPFFEFIQRVCSEKAAASGECRQLRPGCGGFGIRNFLTLFLSIEVSKAMDDANAARAKGDAAGLDMGQRRVALFTDQLNESNPILTMISDAMTQQGELNEQALAAPTAAKREALEAQAAECEAQKEKGNAMLKEVSAKYNDAMKKLCGR